MLVDRLPIKSLLTLNNKKSIYNVLDIFQVSKEE
nr:MAG TPA: hypothetical protein [Caudoviricetes sp.]